MQISTPSKKQEELFIELATRLTNQFPGLDIRFNHLANSGQVRLRIPDYSSEVLEIPIDLNSVERALYDATFAIKQLCRQFDA